MRNIREKAKITKVGPPATATTAPGVEPVVLHDGDTDGGSCPTAPNGTAPSVRWVQLDNLTSVYTNYCYDASNRLTLVDPGSGSTFAYGYDDNGNRVQTDENGSTVQTQTVNAADQLTMSGYSYDAAGKTLTDSHGSMTWNAADQMTTLNDGTAHNYSYADPDQTELITSM